MPFGETATGLDVIRSTTSGAADQVVCLSMGGGNSPARPDSIYVRAWYGGTVSWSRGGAESVTKSLNGAGDPVGFGMQVEHGRFEAVVAEHKPASHGRRRPLAARG